MKRTYADVSKSWERQAYLRKSIQKYDAFKWQARTIQKRIAELLDEEDDDMIYNATNSGTATATITWASTSTISTSNFTSNLTPRVWVSAPTAPTLGDLLVERDFGRLKQVGQDYEGEIQLPDKTVIKCQKGDVEIIYSDGKRIYRPCNIRDFNRFLNASDMLELFLKEVAPLARTKKEFMALPVELFIKWLVIKAAEQDGEQPPTEVSLPVPLLPAPVRHIHRCRSCQRFIPRKRYEAGVFFCRPEHMTRYLEKVVA